MRSSPGEPYEPHSKRSSKYLGKCPPPVRDARTHFGKEGGEGRELRESSSSSSRSGSVCFVDGFREKQV